MHFLRDARMLLFELVVALLLVGAVLSLWASRIGIPYPALLALAGVALAFSPHIPRVELDPNLALALFVAPVLLDAAFDASPRDLKNNLWSVSSLAVVAVLLTAAAVALVVHRLVPDLGWAAAVALGAIVAPPDASAATAVLRKLRLPHRLLVVLEGESLFNDATALLVYRIAVTAALTGTLSRWRWVPLLGAVSLGSVVMGIVLARMYLSLTVSIAETSVSILLQFIGTFAVWMLADRLGLSGILTMIAYAMTLARVGAGRLGAERRIASYAVWDVAVFVLNVLAFVLIGLELGEILSRARGAQWILDLRCAAAVCGTVILVRIAGVMTQNTAIRWWQRKSGAPRRPGSPTLGSGLLVSWCGMRGIVTLATALALPQASATSAGFPGRDLIVFCAYTVVLFTLVVQGLTLRPLMHWLDLQDDGSVERELLIARAETARAAIEALDADAGNPVAQALRREYEARVQTAEHAVSQAARDASAQAESLVTFQRRAVAAQRRKLVELRALGVIGDNAYHALEEEIDLFELTADARISPARATSARMPAP
jgi:monovalent cation/hydrogen antiporter